MSTATQATFSPREIAERYAVAPEKVLLWIDVGELAAVNVASPGSSRPRWRVTAEALEAFERRRAAVPPAPRPKRRQRPADVKRFF